jgi:hypothetical protein
MIGVRPAYDLAQIKGRVAGGAFVITLQARQDAYRLGLDAQNVKDCVLGLSVSDFYKTMKSERFPEQYQDVYYAAYAGFELYVKLQMRRNGPAVVISFKLR